MKRAFPVSLVVFMLTVGCADIPTGKEYDQVIAGMVQEGKPIKDQLNNLYDKGFRCYPAQRNQKPEKGDALWCVRKARLLLTVCNQMVKLIYSDTTGLVEKIEPFVECIDL